MLSSIRLENYRCFSDLTTLELRPLTLLFGYNNTGKSALLRILPLLSDSVGPNTRGVLSLDSLAARGSTFEDLICKFSGKPEIELELTWESGDDSTAPARYQFRIRDLQDFRRQVIIKFEVFNNVGKSLLAAEWIPEGQAPGMPGNRYEITTPVTERATFRVRFAGIVPSLDEGKVDRARNKDIALPIPMHPEQLVLEQLNDLLQKLPGQVQWIGSLRRVPERSGRFRGDPPAHLKPDGDGACDILAFDSEVGGPLLTEVSAWYERHFNHRLDVEFTADNYSIVLRPLETPALSINIVDTGEGISQVLPILVAAASARSPDASRRGLLAVEQPELHLHPAAERALAQYLCKLAAEPEPPIAIMETHSENLLLQVQLEIVTRRIDPALVAVYWVRQIESGSVAEYVTFDDLGRPLGNWPPGVFSEGIEQAREIIQTRRSRESV